MAEAEIGVEAVIGAAGDEEVPDAAQARQLLALSAGEYRLASTDLGDRQPTEVLFALPVPLQTARRSNVRTGPGLTFRVLFTVDAATPVVGHSYTEQWVRINDDQGRDGWIFHALVTGPGESGR